MTATTPKPAKLSKTAANILRERVNNMLAAPGGTREGRIALSVLLENVLHDARSYRGYSHLEVNGEGLKRYHEFLKQPLPEGLYDEAYNAEYKIRYQEAFGDDSRRWYF